MVSDDPLPGQCGASELNHNASINAPYSHRYQVEPAGSGSVRAPAPQGRPGQKIRPTSTPEFAVHEAAKELVDRVRLGEQKVGLFDLGGITTVLAVAIGVGAG